MHFMRFARPREAGFTLIEVLTAVALLGLMMTLVSWSLSSTFRIVEGLEEHQDVDHQARMALVFIRDDLMMSQSIRRFPWRGQNGGTDGHPGDELAFVSSSYKAQGMKPEADLTQVLYVREGARLTRFALNNIFASAPEAVERTDLADGVIAFNIRYYDGSVNAWTDEWNRRDWKSLPKAVMVELTLQTARHGHRTFREWVVIPR
jgi:type II secretion system protein J